MFFARAVGRDVQKCLTGEAVDRVPGGKSQSDDDWYRSVLLKHLDWLPNDSSNAGSAASAGSSRTLCPIVVCLQLLVQASSMRFWPAGDAASDPDVSPLRFVWAWASTSSSIGKQTADVIALVAMGGHTTREVIWQQRLMKRQLEEERAREGWWAKMVEKVSACFEGEDPQRITAQVTQPPSQLSSSVQVQGSLTQVQVFQPARSDQKQAGQTSTATHAPGARPHNSGSYQPLADYEDKKELLVSLHDAMQTLRTMAERYIHWLEQPDKDKERKVILQSMGNQVWYIMSKSGFHIPSDVLDCVTRLTSQGE